MKRSTRLLALGLVVTPGLMTIASGQDQFPEPTVESRILELEDMVARLNTVVQLRTEVSGPQDRVSRDFNLDQRLGNLERQVQQLTYEMSNINSQISSAVSAANQAQRDAQMAQQMVRDLSIRVR
jgi:uncharacterized protein YlxW (UPF0749 family)